MVTLRSLNKTKRRMNEILNCHHLNESYKAILARGAVYYAVQVAPPFQSIAIKGTESTFLRFKH